MGGVGDGPVVGILPDWVVKVCSDGSVSGANWVVTFGTSCAASSDVVLEDIWYFFSISSATLFSCILRMLEHGFFTIFSYPMVIFGNSF